MEFSDIRAIISYAYNLHKGNCLETTRRSVHVGSRPRPKLERNLYIFSSFFFFFLGSKEERKEERKRRASETKGSFKRIEKKKTISLIDTTRYRDFVFFFFSKTSISNRLLARVSTLKARYRRRICDSKSIEDTILLEMDRRELYRTKGRGRRVGNWKISAMK